VAILLADFFNLPVAILHADYHTSLEALQRWSNALTNADESTADEILQTPKSRERQIDKAAKQVNQELRD